MKKFSFFLIFSITSLIGIAQPGSIKTEQYQAEFEKKQSIDVVSEYTDSIKIPIQLLKIGINEELYEMYPELKDKFVKYLNNKENDETLNMIKDEIKLMMYNNKSMIEN